MKLLKLMRIRIVKRYAKEEASSKRWVSKASKASRQKRAIERTRERGVFFNDLWDDGYIPCLILFIRETHDLWLILLVL